MSLTGHATPTATAASDVAPHAASTQPPTAAMVTSKVPLTVIAVSTSTHANAAMNLWVTPTAAPVIIPLSLFRLNAERAQTHDQRIHLLNLPDCDRRPRTL